MILKLPCKLGEEFMALKFKDWVDGVKIYEKDKNYTLRSVWKGLFGTDCSGYDKNKRGKFFSYDEYTREFIESEECSLNIDDKYFTPDKLSEWGFPSEKTGYLLGFKIEGTYTLVEFCVLPRYEHFYFVIDDLNYGNEKIIIKYNALLDDEWKILSKTQSIFSHGEELLLDENEKNILIELTIKTAKMEGIKVRRCDIDRNRLRISKDYDGIKIYFVFIDKNTLVGREKQIPKRLNKENIMIEGNLIIFKFGDINQVKE